MNGELGDQNNTQPQTDKGKRQKLLVNFGEDSRTQVKKTLKKNIKNYL